MNKNQTNKLRAKKWLVRFTLLFIMLAIILVAFFYITQGPQNRSLFSGIRKVTIQKENGQYSFFRYGKPFLVKGGSGFTHIKELVECGGNTITCWDTSKLDETLQEAAKYKVEVIIGLDMPGGKEDFYKDEKKVTALLDAYTKIVLRYKDHSSLFAWCLGNELIIPFSLSTPPFYKAFNALLTMMHNSDPNHPVSTAMINVAKRDVIKLQWRIPALDFICINTYNQIKNIQTDINLMKWFWSGPYLILEWAPNGGWESEVTSWGAPIENTSTKKAKQYYDLYTKYMPINDPGFLGSLAFYWGSREEYTHTWYSIFNEEGFPTEIKETLYDCWRDTITKHIAPKLQYMLIDKEGAKENIILSSGSIHTASILLATMESADSLRYSWQILKEDWAKWGQTWNDFKKPKPEMGLLTDSTLQNTSFKAPLKEGPYRVFVTVSNSKGYCATANTPIYVIE